MIRATCNVLRSAVGLTTLLVVTGGCGLAPTGIGHDRDGKDPADAQLEALADLVDAIAVEFKSASRNLCFELDYGVYYESPRPSYQYACTVYERTEGGPANSIKGSGCRLSFITQTFSERTILFECAQSGQQPCAGEGTELARLTTAADFVGIRETAESLDGKVLTDTTNPAVSATLHDTFGFCESEFADDDDDDATN